MNMTVTSNGVQFDRLGIIYLGDIEVFRTSTAEPGGHEIRWTYVKEMDQYHILWSQPQKLIFDLGNLIDEKYTGAFNITLTATFFSEPSAGPYADLILPISKRLSDDNKGSAFSVPGEDAIVSQTLPRNVRRAVVSLSANGQGTGEEFWYTNTLDFLEDTFKQTVGRLNSYSPDRRVLLLIDGRLAGLVLPYPVIFTGGIAPGFWRRIVGIQTFDLREHEIDITPFLSLLCDGKPHNMEIQVRGWSLQDGIMKPSKTEAFWVVTGKIFLFLDQSGFVTTGTDPVHNISGASTQISFMQEKDPISDWNESLSWWVYCYPGISLEVRSQLELSDGAWDVGWSQKLAYHMTNKMTEAGSIQHTGIRHGGEDYASRRPLQNQSTTPADYHFKYEHFLEVQTAIYALSEEVFLINASIKDFLYESSLSGFSIFPSGLEILGQLPDPLPSTGLNEAGLLQTPLDRSQNPQSSSVAKLATRLKGNAKYVRKGNYTYSGGVTEQQLTFNASQSMTELGTNIYRRVVEAHGLNLTKDVEYLIGQSSIANGLQGLESTSVDNVHIDTRSPREILGRGPGPGVIGRLILPGHGPGQQLLRVNNAGSQIHTMKTAPPWGL